VALVISNRIVANSAKSVRVHVFLANIVLIRALSVFPIGSKFNISMLTLIANLSIMMCSLTRNVRALAGNHTACTALLTARGPREIERVQRAYSRNQGSFICARRIPAALSHAKLHAVRLPHPQRISGSISDQAEGLAKEAAGAASGRLMLSSRHTTM